LHFLPTYLGSRCRVEKEAHNDFGTNIVGVDFDEATSIIIVAPSMLASKKRSDDTYDWTMH